MRITATTLACLWLGAMAAAQANPAHIERIPNPADKLGQQAGFLMPPTAVLAAPPTGLPGVIGPHQPALVLVTPPAELAALAGSGDATAQVALAGVYAGPQNGTEHGYQTAIAWYRRLLATGSAGSEPYARAEADYGRLLLLGRGAPRDPAAALTLLNDAARRGNGNAMATLGLAYMMGWGAKSDFATAQSWLRKAVAAGDASARTNLGVMYLEGWGTPRSLGQAFALFREAAAAGDDDAFVKMGEMSLFGMAVPVDYGMARVWFERAARADNPLGVFELGALYARGVVPGPTDPYEAAYRLYLRAASEGLPAAQGEIAAYNYLGLGRKRNPQLALKWALTAAANGDSIGQYFLPRIQKVIAAGPVTAPPVQ